MDKIASEPCCEYFEFSKKYSGEEFNKYGPKSRHSLKCTNNPHHQYHYLYKMYFDQLFERRTEVENIPQETINDLFKKKFLKFRIKFLKEFEKNNVNLEQEFPKIYSALKRDIERIKK